MLVLSFVLLLVINLLQARAPRLGHEPHMMSAAPPERRPVPAPRKPGQSRRPVGARGC
jgi:hypothetical protein